MKTNDTLQQWISWRGTGARARTVGRRHWHILRLVPWIDALIVAALLFAISRQITLSPAVAFELPAAPFTEGARAGASLVLLPAPDDAAAPRTIAFFDDVRYIVGSDDEALLSKALADYARGTVGGHILLLADADVRHGDVMRVVNLVRGAGVTRVNVAVKPE